MVIGRDIIPIHIIDTYTQFPVSGGGGGGTITLATTSSGNYNNCLKVGFYAGNPEDYSYSNGIEDGSNSTLGTATSPTRTTQEFDISSSALLTAYNSNAQSGFEIVIGGYMRHTGSSISSPSWHYNPSGSIYGVDIVSASLSNSCSLSVSHRTTTTYSATQDCTSMTTGNTNAAKGIYNWTGGVGSGPSFWEFSFGSGRGASSMPASGDDIILRVYAGATVDGSPVTAIHDITINFVT